MNCDHSMQRIARRAGAICVLLLASVLQQGCLAGAWVVAVGFDSLRTSDITFWPFEQSWVSLERPTEIVERSSLTSVAVLPVEGDEDMRGRLAQILQRQTTLRVESSSTIGREIVGHSGGETKRAELVKELSRELEVDAVLFGRVAGTDSHPSDWGWKNEELCRLYLYLVDRDGHLLWKDELPFTVVTGSKPPIEHSVQAALDRHLMDHVRNLGLDDLGYLPPRAS